MKKRLLLFSFALLICSSFTIAFADESLNNGSVVQILDDSGNWFCTGFFVSKNVVVTAAHCVVDREGSFLPISDDLFKQWKRYSLNLPFKNNWLEVPMRREDFLRPGISISAENNEKFRVASIFVDEFYFTGDDLPLRHENKVHYNPLKPLWTLHDRAVIVIDGETKLRTLTLPSRWLFTFIAEGPDMAKGVSFEENSTSGAMEYKEQNFYPMRSATCSLLASHQGIGYDSNSFLFWYYLNPPPVIPAGEDRSLLKPGASGGPTFYQYKNEWYPIGVHNSMVHDSKDIFEDINIDISTFGIKQFLDLLRKEDPEIDAAKEGPEIPAPSFKEAEPGIFATGTFKHWGHTYRFVLGHSYDRGTDGEQHKGFSGGGYYSQEQIFIKSIKKISSEDKHNDRYINLDEKEYSGRDIDPFSLDAGWLKKHFFNDPEGLWWVKNVSEFAEVFDAANNEKATSYAGGRGSPNVLLQFTINIDFRNPEFFMIEKIQIMTDDEAFSVRMDNIGIESIERVDTSSYQKKSSKGKPGHNCE
ncbi:MAG TPA: trypsin-like serine protease [Bdellovibrionota bacterium]|nr:trypsin-like serine protease [Bdellovibrionota bacterium]